jgi:selenocysteine-specific elongation factor
MATQNFIVATAGHVDHGKSALVKALTGTDPDRLPEEKARGITIDLGFAHLDLPAVGGAGLEATSSDAAFSVGIIDVPGHEDFVKNMVAGVGSIDLALFVVAADDRWMPQTEEHLQILAYLGVSRAVVALTKIDLIESDEEAVVAAVRAQLQASPFAEASIVKTSAVTGRGLEELKSTLARALAATPPPRDLGKPRLPVDRVFTLRGVGTVVTGTLSSGTLRRGQSVIVQPSGQTTRIRSLQTHNRDVEMTGPGTRTAINLPDLSAEAVRRGEVITLPELGRPASTADVLLEKSARLMNAKLPAARPLKDGALVRVHHGSANWPARVLLFEEAALPPGQQTFAQLRFESPAFLFVGDRFIVRDWAEQTTLAGGVVLDAEANRRHWRGERQRLQLAARARSLADPAALVVTELARDHVAPIRELLLQSRFSAAEIATAINRLISENQVVQADPLVAEAAWWKALRQQAAALIQAEHSAHPEKPGLLMTELRRKLEGDLLIDGVFEALLADLCRHEFEQRGVAIRHKTHQPALPPRLQAAGAKLQSRLAAKPFEPPARKELAADPLAEQALRFFVESGQVVELGDEVVMSAEDFARAAEIVRQCIGQRGAATASDLRQALGTNRRVIIPLLERLDRDGVTLRQGDKRLLRRQKTNA